VTPGYAKPRSELPWLPYRTTDKVFVINSHNFPSLGFNPAVNGKMPIAAWIPTRSQSADDLVGSNNGTLTNGASIVADTGAGGTDAFDFDGVDDHVVLPADLLPDVFAISGWVKTTGRMTILGAIANDTNGRSVQIGTTGARRPYIQISLTDDTYFFLSSTPPAIPSGVWTHLIFSRNGTAMTVYQDGVALSATFSGASAAAIQPNASNNSIGRITSFYSSGRSDDIRIWDQVMNTTDAADLYAAGRGGQA
jgi:hypothetical protein